MLTTILMCATLVSAGLPFLGRTVRGATFYAFAGSTAVFALGLAVGVSALTAAPGVVGGLWYLDPLAGLLVLLIAFVQWTATIASISYLTEEGHDELVSVAQARHYGTLVALFVLSMFVVVVSDNLGLMWVALEATTLTTALLVAFYQRPGALEAAWKYLILCSTGIALGLMGVVLTYAAATAYGFTSVSALSYASLLASHGLPAKLMRLSFAFIIVGYGTKIGLVPMHTWLPDAHSSAPSPVSGMLSGILLTTALFAVLRFKTLADLSLGSAHFTNDLLLAFGVLTTVVSALFVLVQLDYKRLLAYSSIEHMGLMTFAFGLGAPGVTIGIIHLIGHTLAKPMLFFGAGNILVHFKSTKFDRVRAVARVLPYTAGLFLFGLLALLAVPPSPLFMSELLLAWRAMLTHPYLLIAVLGALALVFYGFARAFVPFLFMREESDEHRVPSSERWNSVHTAMAFHGLLIVLFGGALLAGPALPFLYHIATFIQ